MGNSDPIIPRVPFEVCPIRSSLGVLGKKWTLLVMRDVAFYRLVKFSQILKNNPGLTPRVLSLRLVDGKPHQLAELFPDERSIMLGRLLPYARGGKARARDPD